jgi:hypothetical protein
VGDRHERAQRLRADEQQHRARLADLKRVAEELEGQIGDVGRRCRQETEEGGASPWLLAAALDESLDALDRLLRNVGLESECRRGREQPLSGEGLPQPLGDTAVPPGLCSRVQSE